MSNRGRASYEIDPHNRLIARPSGKASGVKGFRHVLDGRFKISPKNTLTYHIKKSSNSDIPQQIKFSGNYSLDKDRNLTFTLNKWNNQIEGNKLILKTELLGARDNELSFLVSTQDLAKNRHSYTMVLHGSWQATKQNRLSFNVTKNQGPNDNLVLENAWKIGKNNEIIYDFVAQQKLTFKGYWNIIKKHQISYVLNKDIDSKFDFEISLLKPIKNGLKYKISIGKSAGKFYNISGIWKLIETKNKTLTFSIITFPKRDPKISIVLARKILKDQGQTFVEAQKEGQNLSLIAGLGFRW